MRFLTPKTVFILLSLVSLLACVQDKPKVLLIGDSISIGYTPFVKEALANKADVFHNPGNAQHTGTGLKKIEEWMGTEKWDIIQFNWGLWDLCYRHPDSKVQGNRDKAKGKITLPIEEYAANLDSIVRLLQAKTEASLIFVTTTYVPENEAGRFQQDAIRYNDAAKEVMKNHSIKVNDIYEASMIIHQEFGKGSDDVHYFQKGYEKLSEPVTKFLHTEIASLKRK